MTSKDEALFDFTARVLDLVRRTRRREVGRFAKTAVKADDLVKLGKFLTDLANLMQSRLSPGKQIVQSPGENVAPLSETTRKAGNQQPEA